MHYSIPVIKSTWNDIIANNIERAKGIEVLVLKGKFMSSKTKKFI